MLKILMVGVFATAAVWFVTSDDHVSNLIERDLKARIESTVSAAGNNQLDFTVAGRDVVLYGASEFGAREIERTAAAISNISGVGSVHSVSRFSSEAEISDAIATLAQLEPNRLAAYVKYDGNAITLTGNGAGLFETDELLSSFAVKNNKVINNYLRYENNSMSADWMRVLSTWVDILPQAGPGWLMVTEGGNLLSMNTPKTTDALGVALQSPGLVTLLNHGQNEQGEAGSPLMAAAHRELPTFANENAEPIVDTVVDKVVSVEPLPQSVDATVKTAIADNGGINEDAWIMAQQADGYTIQIGSTPNRPFLVSFSQLLDDGQPTAIFQYDAPNGPGYVLSYGLFSTDAEANNALEGLSKKVRRYGALTRKLGDIQQQIRQISD